jgi:hypothetical protein
VEQLAVFGYECGQGTWRLSYLENQNIIMRNSEFDKFVYRQLENSSQGGNGRAVPIGRERGAGAKVDWRRCE